MVVWYHRLGAPLVFLCTCLHGVRSHHGSPMTIGALDLAIAEDQVVPSH